MFINLLSLGLKKCEVMRIYLNIKGKGKGNGKGKGKDKLRASHCRSGDFLRSSGGSDSQNI